MKKNSKLMRASGILLVLTLITSCFVGGTFAKYVSEGQGSDKARVAKWGVEVGISSKIFDTEYKTSDDDGTVTVSSSTKENVVAPGTNGKLYSINISGEPETSVKVTSSPELTLAGETEEDKSFDWSIDTDDYQDSNIPDEYQVAYEFYCPIEFVISSYVGDPTTISGKEYAQKVGEEASDNRGREAFEAAVEDAIQNAIAGNTGSDSITFPHNYNLEALSNVDISWSWDFGDSDYTNKPMDSQSITEEDWLDTALGNKAANPGSEEAAPMIQLDLGIRIEQVD